MTARLKNENDASVAREKLRIPYHPGRKVGHPACNPQYYRGNYSSSEGGPNDFPKWTPESRAAYEAKVDWFHKAKFGIMFHFTTNMNETPQNQRTTGWTSEKWNAWIDAVDVEKVADQAAMVGAGYVMMCISQVGQYYCAPNPLIEKYWQLKPYQYASRRDLPMELSEALKKRGIRMMLYTAPAAQYGLPLPPSLKGPDRYYRWLEVMKWDSEHYGEACAGWWVDDVRQFVPNYVEDTYAALKSGNPNTIIASGYYGLSDYYTGHCYNHWGMQRSVLPYFGRWEPEYKIQWHQFLYIGSSWGQPGISHDTGELAEYARKVIEGGGVITFDVGTHDGRGNGPSMVIQDDQLAQLCAIRDAVKDTPASDGAEMRQRTLQELLLDTKDEFIELWAAWPRHWTDTFELQAPQGITISGTVDDGVLVELGVSPAERRQDLRLPGQNGIFDERAATKPFANR